MLDCELQRTLEHPVGPVGAIYRLAQTLSREHSRAAEDAHELFDSGFEVRVRNRHQPTANCALSFVRASCNDL